MLHFKKIYFLLSLLLLFSEILIGLYLHDSLIRPYVGDFLVVILLYCLVKSFWALPTTAVTGGVLIFAYTVEISQYFHLVKLLGLQTSKVAVLLLGSNFSFLDLLVYTLGIWLVSVAEKIRTNLKMSLTK